MLHHEILNTFFKLIFIFINLMSKVISVADRLVISSKPDLCSSLTILYNDNAVFINCLSWPTIMDGKGWLGSGRGYLVVLA